MKNKILYVLIAFFLLSCKTTEITTENTEEKTEVSEEKIVGMEIKQPTQEEIKQTFIDELIENMTIEEKIGQLFIFQIRGYKSLTPNLKEFLDKYKPGGIILFSNNIVNDHQVETLIQEIQRDRDIPMFIGVDEEGGIVSRLGKNSNISVTHLPPALDIGNTGNVELAYNSGKILGRELTALGFNMDMAPVADVNTNPNNPVIGNRTYSADPIIAGEMVSQVIKGLHEYNIASVIKHFPGHGDTSLDSHLGSVVSPHGRERLNQIEFVPFIYGISAGTDAIMTAHMIMPKISSSPLPATLNPEIITDIIRNDLGFNGIVMTDALDMGAIAQHYSSEKAAILGIKAGIDILLIPYKQSAAYTGLLNAVNSNEISIKRVNKSLTRILSVKYDRSILNKTSINEKIEEVTIDPRHIDLIQTIKSRKK
ncbi:MAG: hypothetical protein B6229_03710 [Spirochaetaceae bacterium 4572_7]|nr:MAG: hypothetical protein B6229_03710 [Spirochaetaceae bacterium 4572_7]